MTAVKKNVDEVEESVATAERELGSHTIQKVLSSIPGLRQVRASQTKITIQENFTFSSITTKKFENAKPFCSDWVTGFIK